MRGRMAVLLVGLGILAGANSAAAQTSAAAAPAPKVTAPAPAGTAVPAVSPAVNSSEPKQQERGWLLSVRFEGSSSSAGQVLDLNSATGYKFNRFFGVDVGVPVYFVVPPVTPSGSGSGSGQRFPAATGLGNAYADLRVNLPNSIANFSSTMTGGFPTGSQAKGHSSGQATYDWDNRFERDFGPLTPYVDGGVGNSIEQLRKFRRPFTTLGHLAHFEAGAQVNIWHSFSVTASAYDILPWGPQQVFSRIVPRGGVPSGPARHGRRVYETAAVSTVTADQVRDNGYGVSASFSPKPLVDLSVGWTRSVPMGLNTISFSIGFNIASMFHHTPTH